MSAEPCNSHADGGQPPLPEQLHLILGEWSQLILSLAALIRENVEGLLPAVFNLAQLAGKASEARVEAGGSTRRAGASLRERAAQLRAAMAPLAAATADAANLRPSLSELIEQAQALAPHAHAVPGLERFLATLATADDAVLPRLQRVLAAAATVQDSGQQALLQLDEGLDLIDTLLHADTAEIETAAGRVRQFADSSRAAVDQLIVKLQFQDRTDQILSHLLADFESLSNALREVGEQPFDAEAWRNERQKRFTTEEERRAGSGVLSTDPGDIELF